MENKIKKEVRLHADYDSFAGALKSKRYTRTNIDRLLLHVLCGLKKKWEIKPASDDPDDGAGREKYAYRDSELYARVLAFNPNGSRLLKKASEVCSIPIITNINKYEHLPDIVKYDIKSSDIYNLLAGKDLYECSDHVRKPFHI
jgi:predicted nucleotidyltransferase